jgi:hypothetical protein
VYRGNGKVYIKRSAYSYSISGFESTHALNVAGTTDELPYYTKNCKKLSYSIIIVSSNPSEGNLP